jgi:hypothetical protein
VRKFHVFVLLGILATSFLALTGLELVYVNVLGWSQHGRYIMPFGVGLILGAVFLHRNERALGDGIRRLVPGIAVVAGAVHLWALLVVQTRFQFGQGRGLNPFGGSWTPPAGAVTGLLVELIGVALLVALAAWSAWRTEVVQVPVPEAEPPSTETVEQGGTVAEQAAMRR